MKKTIYYTCRHCGETNELTGFWRWFFTPHFGSKKWMKCDRCKLKSFMTRHNWNAPSWFDWY